MKADFLERIFKTVSCEGSSPVKGERLCELYDRGAEEAQGAFLEALEKMAASEKREWIVNLYAAAADEREERGFLNGFRLGMKLAGELGGGL